MLIYEKKDTLIVLSGETYPLRQTLKEIGAVWKPVHKQWVIKASEENQNKIEEIGFKEIIAPEKTSEDQNPSDQQVQSQTDLWSVSKLYYLAEKAMEVCFPQSFWISGDITGLKKRNGHIFFDLCEVSSTVNQRPISVSAIIWQRTVENITQSKPSLLEVLADGRNIKIHVDVQLKKETGRLQIIIKDVDLEYSLGQLALKKIEIVKELKKRGLYDRNREHQLTAFPLNIALISAKGSRAYGDFTHELEMSPWGFKVSFFDSIMQGTETSPSIYKIMKTIEAMIETQSNPFNVIIITRGGGSVLDLHWFNDLEIAKAIAYSSIPVIVAVGHYEDQSIADEVAYRSEKTPTGSARFISGWVQYHWDRIEEIKRSLVTLTHYRIQNEIQKQKSVIQKIEQLILFRFQKEKIALDHCSQTLTLLQKCIITSALQMKRFIHMIYEEGLEKLQKILKSLENPETPLGILKEEVKNARMIIDDLHANLKTTETEIHEILEINPPVK